MSEQFREEKVAHRHTTEACIAFMSGIRAKYGSAHYSGSMLDSFDRECCNLVMFARDFYTPCTIRLRRMSHPGNRSGVGNNRSEEQLDYVFGQEG